MKIMKKRNGCLIPFLVFILFAAALIFIISHIIKNPELYDDTKLADNVVFDALQYEVKSDGTNISESELIKKLGNPDSTEEWNYEITGGRYYPMRTLYYGTAEYSFSNDRLQRITLREKFHYDNKDDFLPMFHLKKYANTLINDTNFYYRASNCGVHDLWLEYGDGTITMAKITYGSLFDGA